MTPDGTSVADVVSTAADRPGRPAGRLRGPRSAGRRLARAARARPEPYQAPSAGPEQAALGRAGDGVGSARRSSAATWCVAGPVLRPASSSTAPRHRRFPHRRHRVAHASARSPLPPAPIYGDARISNFVEVGRSSTTRPTSPTSAISGSKARTSAPAPSSAAQWLQQALHRRSAEAPSSADHHHRQRVAVGDDLPVGSAASSATWRPMPWRFGAASSARPAGPPICRRLMGGAEKSAYLKFTNTGTGFD